MSAPKKPLVQSANASSPSRTSTLQTHQGASRNKTWTKNPTNDSHKGKIYESLVALATFLALKNDQEMICEMKEAGKFDDVVVWVENDGYYLRQIKHKQDDNFEIRESNLFPKKSDIFNLDMYLTSFIDQICINQPFSQDKSLVKELIVTTNVDFDITLLGYLELVNPSRGQVDLGDQQQGKRYKFKHSKFNEIKQKLKTTNQFQSDDIDSFLSKFIFEVKQPNLSDMKTLIRQKLCSLFPLELNEEQVEKASLLFLNKLKDFFDNLKGENTSWATVQLRQDFLLDILMQLKETVSFGSTLNFEGKTLLPILEAVNFSLHVPLTIQEDLITITKAVKFYFQNIIVTHETSLPVIASSVVLSHFRRPIEIDFRRFWVIDVKSEEDGLCFANIFKHRNVVFFRDFIFVVEFSQELNKHSVTSNVVTEIYNNLKDIKLPIKFIFITSRAIDPIPTGEVNFSQKNYDNFVKDFFMEDTRKVLSEKMLSLKNGPSISLSQLGIPLINLDSLSLSELALADESSQLDLLLPFYDKEMEEAYVNRKLRLPVIDVATIHDVDLKNRLCFDYSDYENKIETNQNRSVHLLRSLGTIVPGNTAGLLSKSSKEGIDELRKYIDQSSIEVDEDLLISDNVLFEKSHDVKAAVVVDLPGMGKSSLLTHLCNSILKDLERLKEDGSKRKLVLRVNLGICNRKTWELPLKNETDVIEFFFSYYQSNVSHGTTYSSKTMTNLSKRILKEILRGNSIWSIITMLDGFDEISKVGREFVEEKLIRFLLPMKGIDRLIVASRPDGGVHRNLETCFNQFALHLVEFDFEDQESLLVALWLKTIREKGPFPSIDESRISEQCRNIAKLLIYKARNHLKDDDKTILDIPFQCKLFAECFYDDLIKYIQGSTSSLDIDSSFDILALFDTFFANKCHIAYYEKRMLSGARNDREEEMYEVYKKFVTQKAMRVSVYYMTRDMEKAEKVLGEKWDRNKFVEDIAQVEKLGLVAYFNRDALDDGIATSFALVHRTFAEYLVAKYLIDAKSDRNYFLLDNDCGDCILLNMVLFEKEYEGVKRFLPLPHDSTFTA